tara:strand:- start:136 stop:573 length:438 start_codon:yes stop_codon:yes gene_type:complete
MESYLIWFLIATLFFILEIFTLGMFLLFFGVGALLSGVIVCFYPFSLNIQISIFLLSSISCLLCLRTSMKAALFSSSKGRPADNLEDVLGRSGIVTKDILPPANGEINLSGTKWNASSNQKVLAGAAVEVIGRHKLVLEVKQISE